MNFVAHGSLISFSFWGETTTVSPFLLFWREGGVLNLLSAPTTHFFRSIGTGGQPIMSPTRKKCPLVRDIARITSRGEVLKFYSPHYIKE